MVSLLLKKMKMSKQETVLTKFVQQAKIKSLDSLKKLKQKRKKL